jgi:hypothetical protein
MTDFIARLLFWVGIVAAAATVVLGMTMVPGGDMASVVAILAPAGLLLLFGLSARFLLTGLWRR